MKRAYEHLLNDCKSDYCLTCSEPVKQMGKAWYITMAHPGYNSPVNNGSGYASKEKAVAAYVRYKAK